MSNSTKYSFNKEDLKKIGIGLLIALGGALATYLEELIPGLDFGAYSAIAVAINSVLVNALRKFLSGLNQ
jgi:hypothetical protein